MSPDKRAEKADIALREFMETAEPRPYTLEEIAQVMGVTRERVRQIEMKAMKRLRFRFNQLIKEEGITAAEWIRLVIPETWSHEYGLTFKK